MSGERGLVARLRGDVDELEGPGGQVTGHAGRLAVGDFRAVKRLWVLLGATAAATGCGGSASPSGPTLRVAAGSAIGSVLQGCTPNISGVRVRLDIDSTTNIAAEIRRGVLPDVFVATNSGTPAALARAGKVATPVEFAVNALVIAARPGDEETSDLNRLAASDRTIAIGDVSSRLGIHTRSVLGRLPLDQRIALLSRVSAQAPDGRRVVAKVVSRAADAAFVFRSDVRESKDKLHATDLPGELGGVVVYAMAIVNGTRQPQAARRIVDDVLHGGCAVALRRAGFAAP